MFTVPFTLLNSLKFIEIDLPIEWMCRRKKSKHTHTDTRKECANLSWVLKTQNPTTSFRICDWMGFNLYSRPERNENEKNKMNTESNRSDSNGIHNERAGATAHLKRPTHNHLFMHIIFFLLHSGSYIAILHVFFASSPNSRLFSAYVLAFLFPHFTAISHINVCVHCTVY